jgi:glycosyltransferase involved in cell wall biosynthesis
MHWNVAAPFIDIAAHQGSDWLLPYAADPDHQFTRILRPSKERSWHDRPSPVTGYDEWLSLWRQSRTAVKTTQGGVITVFPQLASLVGIQKAWSGQRFPIVAWWFNTNLYTGYKHYLAKASLRSIDRFVVHNTVERAAYSRWLQLPMERFEFVPLQTQTYPITEAEETESPFILAVGSAFRDYPLLFEAVQRLGLRTIVVSGSRTLAGIEIPANVETPFGVKKPEIIALLQRARLVVLPLVEDGLVAGTTALVEALGMGCPLIVSDRPGVEDYIQDGETGLLVKPRSLEQLTAAIDRLWQDEALRDRLRKQSRQYAMEHLTDAAAGASLGRILSQVAEEFAAPGRTQRWRMRG